MDARIFLISVAVIAVTGVPVPEPEINFGQTTTTTTTTPDPLVRQHENISDVCKSMLPIHGNNRPQKTEAPYTIKVNTQEVAPQGIVEVEVESATGEKTIRGVYIQARNPEGIPVGEFQSTADSHVLISDCSGGNNNALLYVSHESVDQLKFEWKAPDTQTEVKFFVTFVETFSIFWKPITSEKVDVKNQQ